MGCYAGVDLGTSGMKVTVVEAGGEALAEAEVRYAVRSPRDGWSESDPADWLAAYHECVAAVTAELGDRRPDAVGFAGQMHGVVLSDSGGDPLRPAVLWSDRRAESVLARWLALGTADRSRLGNPIVAGMAGPTLSWLCDHEPAVVESAALVRSPKDWLRGQLTGDAYTDPSDACATLIWDVVSGDWSEAARTVAGVRADQLPALTGSATVCGTVDWAGDAVPAVTGGADTACVLDALRSVPDLDPTATIVNLGTGIQVLRPQHVLRPRSDAVTHQYLDTSGEGYEMLAVQNGGLALTWALSMMQCGWDDATALAHDVLPGCGGVSFVPFLTGERGHLATPHARAAWTGMTQHTERSALVRSAFEATAFSIRRAREILGDERPVTLTGGGGRDPFVRQLVADALREPIDFVSTRSATATGAAVVAARAQGLRLAPRTEVERVVPDGNAELEDAYHRWRVAVSASSP